MPRSRLTSLENFSRINANWLTLFGMAGMVLIVYFMSNGAVLIGFVAFLTLSAALGTMWIIAKNREKKSALKLKDAGFMYCEECCYNLSSGDTTGVCPECGNAYTKEQLEAHWRYQYIWHLDQAFVEEMRRKNSG